jgi:hypothetical protein
LAYFCSGESESANLCVTAKSPKSTAKLSNGENLGHSLNPRPLSVSPVHFTDAQSS